MAMQIIEEGPRNLVVRFTGAGPDTVDVSALNPPCAELRIMKITEDVPAAASVTLAWDNTSGNSPWTSNGHAETHCFDYFGGIVTTEGVGVNGDITYTGAASAELVVHFRKVRTTHPWPN